MKQNERQTPLVVQKVIVSGEAVMPHSDEMLEEAVLGALLIETSTARRVIPRIVEDYFYKPEHVLIFRAIRRLYEADRAIDILTVAEQLRTDGTLEEAGGYFTVASLSGKVASTVHVDEHVLILSQFYMRRRLREILLTHDHRAADDTEDVADVLVDVMRQLEALAEGLPVVNDLREMPEVLEKVMLSLKRRMENGGGLTGTDTGSAGLNELLLGWQPGTMNVIAARPGEGKTAFLMHTLLCAARAGREVCLISLESGAEKLAERWMLSETGIPPSDWHTGRLTPEQWEQAEQARSVLEKLHIRTFDRGNITVEQVCMMVKALHAQGKCHLLGIDYMQLFQNRVTNGVREQEVAHNSRLLKLLSLKLDIPIVVLSQLNREVKSNQYHMPRLDNIRESGSIEQDADTVSLLFHPKKAGLKVVPEVNYPVSDDLMLLIVAKNRNGRAGTVYLSHNDSMTRFGDYEPPADWLLEQDAQPVEEKTSRSWRGKQSTYKAFKQKKKEDNGGRLPF